MIFTNPINLGKLRKKVVECSKGEKVGKIMDVVYVDTKDIRPDAFIIGGSFWEEFRESLGLIHDIDPVVHLNEIAYIDEKKIKLSIPRDELPHKLQNGVIPCNALIYSSLKRKTVVGRDGLKIGRIVEQIFFPDGKVAFIIGGSFLEELSEKLGFSKDWDLLLPTKYIKSIEEDVINISLNKDELHSTLNNEILDESEALKYLNKIQAAHEAEIKRLSYTALSHLEMRGRIGGIS